MRVSRDFQLAEFLTSQTALRTGIDMTPPEDVLVNIRKLARRVLQPLRDAINWPVIISSGYRPEDLNTLIGGSKTSDHILGCAADIYTTDRSPYELAQFIDRNTQTEGWPIKQLIHEFGGWVHVSVTPEGVEAEKPQALTAYRDGGTKYANGILEVDRRTRVLV